MLRATWQLRSAGFLGLRRSVLVALLLAGVVITLSLSSTRAQSKKDIVTDFAQFRPRKELPGEQFAGRAVCAGCHSEKTHSQVHTSMARALFLPSQSAVLKSHPRLTYKSGIYSYEIVADGSQTIYRVTDGKETLSEPILYAFGNARIAQTFIFRHNGRLQEGRVSYYTAIDGLDWTVGDALNSAPNVEEAAGRDISGDEARNCFSCHGTAAVVNTKLQMERLILGVTCEACHGPGEKHSVAMLFEIRDTLGIFNPKALDPQTLSQEFCGACHRGVDTVAMMPDLGGINNVRFQPYRLFNSRGHDPKDARFACTVCHDPHEDLKQEDSVYDEKCTTCHATR